MVFRRRKYFYAPINTIDCFVFGKFLVPEPEELAVPLKNMVPLKIEQRGTRASDR